MRVRGGRNPLGEKKGMALLLVLCLFAMLTAFGASVFFAGASAVANATQDTYDEQARLSARSACEAIRAELTGTGDSALRQIADKLEPKSSYTLSAELPESMGEVSGTLTRRSNSVATVELTAEVKGKKCTMRMGFTRTEDAEKKTVIWTFSGYQQNL